MAAAGRACHPIRIASSKAGKHVSKQLRTFLSLRRVCPKALDHLAIHVDRIRRACDGGDPGPDVWEFTETERRDRNARLLGFFENLKRLVWHAVADDPNPDSQRVAVENLDDA
jgi:hypothetical protein